MFFFEFEPLFAKITESRYAKHYIFQECLTQKIALEDNMRDDEDGRDLVENSDFATINPCSVNFIFHGIRKSMK